MTKFHYIAHGKSGINEISLAPSHKARKIQFTILDGALVLGFMAAFIGLVCLLSK
jgi:hypothetical protein